MKRKEEEDCHITEKDLVIVEYNFSSDKLRLMNIAESQK
jgi:hypothetical protein